MAAGHSPRLPPTGIPRPRSSTSQGSNNRTPRLHQPPPRTAHTPSAAAGTTTTTRRPAQLRWTQCDGPFLIVHVPTPTPALANDEVDPDPAVRHRLLRPHRRPGWVLR
ncbi:hypothetical protein MMC32_003015 [Xylographa parallela]|nr:hypothetical protein [Xylographa parallela]